MTSCCCRPGESLPSLAIREACSDVKMPVTDRSLVLDGAYYTNLLGDDVVAKGFVPQVVQPWHHGRDDPPPRRLPPQAGGTSKAKCKRGTSAAQGGM